MTSCLK